MPMMSTRNKEPAWSGAFNTTFDQQQLTVIGVVAVVVAVAAAIIAVIESDVDVVFVDVIVAVAVDVKLLQ